jgi:DNA-binding MarR family transcriptional regulator
MAMTRWLTDDELAAWRGLRDMTSRLDARINRELQAQSGLSLPDYAVLVPLSEAEDDRLRAFELADAIGWEQSRLSHHLSRMHKRGLVDRTDCDADRRGAFVVLTEAGRQAIEAAAPAHADFVRALVFDALTPAQVQTLKALSQTVLQRLDDST